MGLFSNIRGRLKHTRIRPLRWFRKQPYGWQTGQSFSYTVPAGKWHVQETHNYRPDGKGHTVVVLTQQLSQRSANKPKAKKKGI